MHEYIEKLNQLKDEKKKSVEDVAKEMDMSPQFLALVLLGEVVPTHTDIEKIAEYVLSEIG